MRGMTHAQMLAFAAMVKRLEDYAAAVTALAAERDALIHEAHGEGLSNAQIARSLSISRTTVVQVLGTDDEEGGQ